MNSDEISLADEPAAGEGVASELSSSEAVQTVEGPIETEMPEGPIGSLEPDAEDETNG